MLDEIYMQILDMTKIASVVILIVLLARLFLKKAPKVISYALWAVVLFRLLCPVSFPAPVSIVPEVTPVSQSYDLAGESISIAGAGEAAYRAIGDALNGGLGIQHIRTTKRDSAGMTEYVSTDWWDVWILIGQYIWAAGVGVMFLYSMLSCRKIYRKLAVAVPLRDNILVADDIKSPFVMGLFHPKIYLPWGLSEREQEYIILHEQHHIRRLDHIVKALAFFSLCLHWFNPLVWLAFVLANKDMEMSCDEAVIRKMGEEIRADYAASLLTFATGRRVIAGTPLAFGEGDTKGRIKNLARWKKPAFAMVLAAAVGCVILALCLLADPVSEDDQEARKGDIGQGPAVSTEAPLTGPVEMIPTSADMYGAFDSYLYVPLDGEIYRFERTEQAADEVTQDSLLDAFTEVADPENVKWEVYSLKEYPDHSVVLAIAGTDYECLYQYSPSKRSDPDALKHAKENGCVVMENSRVTAGESIWQDFVQTVEEGKSASVQVGHYYTLDPENCGEQYYEANKEDYPVLYVFDLTYDGSGYTLTWNEGSTRHVRKYQYLMHYTGEAPTANATYDTYERYVLTNDNTVTWEDLFRGMISSQFGDYIEHYSIYTDLK